MYKALCAISYLYVINMNLYLILLSVTSFCTFYILFPIPLMYSSTIPVTLPLGWGSYNLHVEYIGGEKLPIEDLK